MAAYDSARLSVNAGGKTGAGVVAFYDASGADTAQNRQGGAAFATSGATSANVNGDDYFPRTVTISGREIETELGALVEQAHTFIDRDALHGTSKNYVDGTGIPILIKASNRLFWDVLFHDNTDGELKLRGQQTGQTGFRID